MQFIDLNAQYQALKPQIDANIQGVLNSAQFIGGSYVKELEAQLAAFTGRKHCITCANGTDALQLAFMAMDVGERDAVFCPDMTFISSTEPANMLGAVSVFCDICSDTYCLDPASLERQIQAVLAEGVFTPKAVVAVDILGNPCDYDAIMPICEKYGLTLIEDAAQSFGACYKGKRACSFGRIAITSFFPAKPLGCYGDGGAVFTDDDELDKLFRSLCVHGKGPGGKYDNIRVGLNSRLDNLQAAVLLPKLKALGDYELEARQTVAKRYNAAFAGKRRAGVVAPHKNKLLSRPQNKPRRFPHVFLWQDETRPQPAPSGLALDAESGGQAVHAAKLGHSGIRAAGAEPGRPGQLPDSGAAGPRRLQKLLVYPELHQPGGAQARLVHRRDWLGLPAGNGPLGFGRSDGGGGHPLFPHRL